MIISRKRISLYVSSLNKEGCLIEISPNDDARPELYHCKGSGDIEYDLDCAMILSKDRGDSRELQTRLIIETDI